jgi:hypothetical protein
MLHIGDVSAAEQYLDFSRKSIVKAADAKDFVVVVEDYLVMTGGLSLQAKGQVIYITVEISLQVPNYAFFCLYCSMNRL